MIPVTMIVTILYYVFAILDEIWQGPLGDAFKNWYKETKGLPSSETRRNLLST